MGAVKVVVAVLLLTVLLQAGGQVTSSRDARHRNRAAALSQSVTSFGASLYRQLTSGNFDNLIFSPFSVFVALTMTLLGANGVTKRELRTVLSVRLQQGVHHTLQSVIASLPTGLDPETNLTVRVANAVYYNQSRITVSPGFSQSIHKLYGGALKRFEERDPEAAINSWVTEVTDGMIPNLLPPGHIADTNTVLMLLNAVFFEMFINIVNEIPSVRAELFLPKFRLRTRQTLAEHLKAMGLRSAFSNGANFRRLSTDSIGISQVLHEAVIEVTETGSRAAAATGVFAVPISASHHSITVNKPFLFILRDKISGINIFIGRFVDPSQEHP